MVTRYEITYVFRNDPYRIKHHIWKFGTSIAELKRTFKEYVKQPADLIEIVISDDED